MLTQLTPAFLKQVQAKGQVVFEQLEDLIAPLPIVKDVTGMGLMIGIHLTADVKVADVIAELQKHGMLHCQLNTTRCDYYRHWS